MYSTIPRWVTTLAVALVLSGCAEGTPKSTRDAATLATDSPTGEISGLITDDEFIPLAGTEVGLRGKASATRTDDLGEYRFTDLQPGRYAVDVSRIGFTVAAQEVDVRAGQVTTVDFRLGRLPIPEAVFAEVSHFTGFYDCALAIVVWVSACTYPYTAAYYTLKDHGLAPPGLPSDVQNNTFRYNFTVAPGAFEAVSEMVWQPTTAASEKMMLILSCGDYDPVADDCGNLLTGAPTYARVQGKSPLYVKWDAKRAVEDGPAWVMSRGYLPFSPPQVAFQQRFDMWNSVFYNGPAPEGYSLGQVSAG